VGNATQMIMFITSMQ